MRQFIPIITLDPEQLNPTEIDVRFGCISLMEAIQSSLEYILEQNGWDHSEFDSIDLKRVGDNVHLATLHFINDVDGEESPNDVWVYIYDIQY